MGGNPVNGETSKQLSFSELFIQMFPYYVEMGMSYEEYWRGPLWLVKSYREVNKLRREEEEAARHRQGAYFMQALRVAMSGFRKDKSSVEKYPDEPWPITEKEAKEREARDAKRRYFEMRDKLMAEAKQYREQKALSAQDAESDE